MGDVEDEEFSVKSSLLKTTTAEVMIDGEDFTQWTETA